jgi:hypothetical protein
MRSQQAIERLWSGFHEPEPSHAHAEMLWQGYFHERTVERSVARTFFLAFKLHCACDAAFPGQSPCTQKLMRMPSEVSDTFCWPSCSYLARLEDPHASRTWNAILIFSQRIQGAKTSTTTELSFLRLDISTVAP